MGCPAVGGDSYGNYSFSVSRCPVPPIIGLQIFVSSKLGAEKPCGVSCTRFQHKLVLGRMLNDKSRTPSSNLEQRRTSSKFTDPTKSFLLHLHFHVHLGRCCTPRRLVVSRQCRVYMPRSMGFPRNGYAQRARASSCPAMMIAPCFCHLNEYVCERCARMVLV